MAHSYKKKGMYHPFIFTDTGEIQRSPGEKKKEGKREAVPLSSG